MLNKLKEFFQNELAFNAVKSTDAEQKYSLEQACSLLLMEVSGADFEQSNIEKDKIKQLLKSLFELSDEKLDELFERSNQASKDTTSMHPFTSMINDNYEYDQKVNLLNMMWKVAFVDDNLDKYEEAMIRKIADLLYISHSDYIKVKHIAAEKRE
jgi:uncharacterized tellurite resistance protein B-like protein